jgi:hypothetical protein
MRGGHGKELIPAGGAVDMKLMHVTLPVFPAPDVLIVDRGAKEHHVETEPVTSSTSMPRRR